MILDSGERTVHENGFQRDMHEGKGRMDLLPWRAIIELSKHCEEGAKKYGERNVDLGAPQKSLIDSAFRHLAKYHIGMDDEDHLRACAWNIMWALEQENCRQDLIDTYREEMKGPKVAEVEEVEKTEVHLFQCKECGIVFTASGDGVKCIQCGSRATNYGVVTVAVGPSVHEERRCVEMTCFDNENGFCQSVGDLWNPDLGKDCPGFVED